MFTRAFFILSLGFSIPALGQLDPSSAILLRSGGRIPEKEKLDSSRYTIRPGEPRAIEPVPRPPEPVRPPQKSTAKTTEVTPNLPASVAPENQAAEAKAVEGPKPEAPVVEQVKTLVLGGSPEQIDTYVGKLHPDDARNNLMEIWIAPGFSYTDASANYWFRGYSVAAPSVQVGGQIWITPFFGIGTNFINTLGGSIYETIATHNRISLDQQWFDAGFRWRKFLGTSRKATVVGFGLDYSEYKTKVPSDAIQRVSTQTVGAKISLDATVPRGLTFAWQFGAFVTPRANHKEVKTALDMHSGNANETTVVGLFVGGQHTFERRSQLFWRIQHSVERNLFDGAASLADPATGATPEGVSVTTSTTMFNFGYRWGN
jgi:hypothetical protein